MAKVGQLTIEMAANVARLQKDMDRAYKSVDGAMAKVRKSAQRARRSLGNIAGALVAGLGVRSMVRAGNQSLEMADKFAKASRSVGISVEALSAYNHAAELSGTSVDAVIRSAGRLSANMKDMRDGVGEAKDAFEELNIKAANTDGTMRGTNEVLLDIAERFSTMPDSARKTALAMDIFGRSGAELIPMLNQGKSGIAAMREEADSLGITFDTKTASAAERVNDQMLRVKRAFTGLTNNVMERLLPAIENISNMMFAAASNSSEMDYAARVLATGLKLLITSGLAVKSVFGTLGKVIGAVAASISFVLEADMKNAVEVLKISTKDVADSVIKDWERIQKVWENTPIESAEITRTDVVQQYADKAEKAHEEELERGEELTRVRIEQVNEYQREFDRVSGQIEQSLTDALMDGGKNGWEYIKGLFRNLVLRPIMQPVVGGVAGGIAGTMMPGAAQAAGGGGMGVPGLGGLLSGDGLGSMFSTSAFSGIQSSLTAGLWDMGFDGASAFVSGMSNGLFGAATAGIGGALLTGITTGDWGKAASTGAGSALGFAVGGPIGAIAGGMLGGMFGSDKPTPHTALGTVDLGTGGVSLDDGRYSGNSETSATRGGLVQTVQEVSNALQSLGATLDGSVLVSAGKRNGLRMTVADKGTDFSTKAARQEGRVQLGETQEEIIQNIFNALFDRADWSGLLDENSAFESFTDDAQSALRAAIESAGSMEDLQSIMAPLQQVGQVMSNIDEQLKVSGMSEYAQQVYEVNQQFDGLRSTLQAAGVDLEEYIDLEELRATKLREVAAAQREVLASELTGALGAISSAVSAIRADMDGFSAAVEQTGAALGRAEQDIVDGYLTAQDDVSAAQQRVNGLLRDSADSMRDFSASIADFLNTMPNADGSRNLSTLRKQFTTTAQRAGEGDADAQNALISQARTLLDAERAASSTAVEYARAQAHVNRELGMVQEALTTSADSLEGQIRGEDTRTPLQAAQDDLLAAQDRMSNFATLVEELGLNIGQSNQVIAGSAEDLREQYNTALEANQTAIANHTTALELLGDITLEAVSPFDSLRTNITALETAQENLLDVIGDNLPVVDGALQDIVDALGLSGDAATTLASLLADPGTAATTLASLLGLTSTSAEDLSDMLGLTGQTAEDFIGQLESSGSSTVATMSALQTTFGSTNIAAAQLASIFGTAGGAIGSFINQLNNADSGRGDSEISAAYQTLFGRDPKQSGLDYWMGTGLSGSALFDAIRAGAQGADITARDLRGFASGTSYVPHDMTARIHAGEEITPRPYVDEQREDRQQMISELKQLRAEIKADLNRVNQTMTNVDRHSKDTSDTLTTVTRGGRAIQTESFS